jgi:hypothetical protein
MTIVLLSFAALLQLLATLEVPSKLFFRLKRSPPYETMANVSRFVCIAGAVAGVLVCRFAVPRNWTESILMIAGALALIGLMAVYIKMAVRRERFMMSPADVITHGLRSAERPAMAIERPVSALAFGWLPFAIWAIWLASEVSALL